MGDITPNPPMTQDYLRGIITQPREGELKPPANIMMTVQGAKALYFQCRTEHLARINLYASIEGLLAGNPPYNPAELARYKLSHITNFNNLDARALYERGALAYWNLLNEAETICEFEIRPTSLFQTATGDELVDWAETMSLHWDEVVRSWPSFNVVFNTLTGQLVKFGISPTLWPDERDWRWRVVEASRFYVEDQAQTDVDLLTYVAVETNFTVQFLFEVYETFKDKKNSPWNIDELTRLILYFANTFAKNFNYQPFYDMMDIQRRIQNGDLTYTQVFSDRVQLVSLFYKEYDGKVSHYMFHPLYDAGDFLYFADRQYDSMEDGVIIFTASPGEFTIHSNKGLGQKLYSGAQAMMQLDCSIIDMARMSATPLIETLSSGTKDFEQIRFYPGVPTLLGQAKFAQNNLGANINQLIMASQYMLNKLQFNTANSGDDPSVPDKSVGSISPTQARMQSYREFSVLKNNIAHFYGQFDRVIQNMTVKMLHSKKGYPGFEYVDLWKKRCIVDGVPKEVFELVDDNDHGMPAHLKVRATRVAGDGSTLAKIMGLQELLPISQGFGPKEEKEYKREWIIAALGPQYVRSFLQDSQDAEAASGGASLAGVENIGMKIGESPIFSMDNEHRAHFTIHLALGNDTIRRIQQQQSDPLQADKIFTVLIPHMLEHYQALEKNIFAKDFVQQMRKPWDELQQYATLNRHNAAKELQGQIKKQQEQQSQQQQVLSDVQLKQLSTQAKIDDNRTKVQAQIENTKQANQNRADIMREKVQLDAQNDSVKNQLKAQNETLDQQNQALQNEPLPELRQNLADINGTSPSPYNVENP